jgi:hypothetical protein
MPEAVGPRSKLARPRNSLTNGVLGRSYNSRGAPTISSELMKGVAEPQRLFKTEKAAEPQVAIFGWLLRLDAKNLISQTLNALWLEARYRSISPCRRAGLVWIKNEE